MVNATDRILKQIQSFFRSMMSLKNLAKKTPVKTKPMKLRNEEQGGGAGAGTEAGAGTAKGGDEGVSAAGYSRGREKDKLL